MPLNNQQLMAAQQQTSAHIQQQRTGFQPPLPPGPANTATQSGPQPQNVLTRSVTPPGTSQFVLGPHTALVTFQDGTSQLVDPACITQQPRRPFSRFRLNVELLLPQMPPGTTKEDLADASPEEIERLISFAKALDPSTKLAMEQELSTRPVTYAEQVDNRLDQLHPACLIRKPLSDPSTYWHLVPTKVEPVVLHLPLYHLGLEYQLSPKTVEMCHDRTKTLVIKYFLRSNVSVHTKPCTITALKNQPGSSDAPSLVPDLNWREASQVQAVVEALFAYCRLMRLRSVQPVRHPAALAVASVPYRPAPRSQGGN